MRVRIRSDSFCFFWVFFDLVYGFCLEHPNSERLPFFVMLD